MKIAAERFEYVKANSHLYLNWDKYINETDLYKVYPSYNFKTCVKDCTY